MEPHWRKSPGSELSLGCLALLPFCSLLSDLRQYDLLPLLLAPCLPPTTLYSSAKGHTPLSCILSHVWSQQRAKQLIQYLATIQTIGETKVKTTIRHNSTHWDCTSSLICFFKPENTNVGEYVKKLESQITLLMGREVT